MEKDRNNGVGVSAGVVSKTTTTTTTGFLCRQSSSRWIPTSDQIRILRDLYYVNGLRSPNAEQIQRISARLRQYGKIEGKNVFYWFQNHKARERQKKRLTVDHIPPSNKYSTTNLPPGVAAGHFTNSMHMERSFKESSSSMGWVGVEVGAASTWSTTTQHGMAEHESREMETLQLFPMNAQEEQGEQDQHDAQELHGIHGYYNNGYVLAPNNPLPEFYWTGSGLPQQHQDSHYYSNGTTSLELTLNSYYYEGST
ncbi:hypothetical protein J5N97_023887 [Dioscorea zingiberensis]|uniref:Homeobox domain-containing protein n=1 Tax=Dioscorea zingiberensis TaxID=325984 RepID=A0A9D5C620_9LILI|nr:hypothetical protein J5N97_023887 [Dioscorea zingiberensis]